MHMDTHTHTHTFAAIAIAMFDNGLLLRNIVNITHRFTFVEAKRKQLKLIIFRKHFYH